MTTTDPFTEAARAEAEQYSYENAPTIGTTALVARAHLHGWEAARTHLAAQEPTDGERAVRELHRPAQVYTLAEDCTDPDAHEWGTASHGGDELCLDEPTGQQFCTECCPEDAFDCTDYPYPCPTTRALDAAHDARVRRDAARVAWYEGQASGWRSAQEECEMNGMVGDLYHPHTETEQCPYEEATP